jgi:hypothetical protein
MNRWLFVGEVVCIALQFERSASTNGERAIEKRLKRDDELLPAERPARPAVDPPGRLIEPTRAYIMTEELFGVAVLLEPSRVDEDSLW